MLFADQWFGGLYHFLGCVSSNMQHLLGKTLPRASMEHLEPRVCIRQRPTVGGRHPAPPETISGDSVETINTELVPIPGAAGLIPSAGCLKYRHTVASSTVILR